MENGWQVVYLSNQLQNIEIVKAALADNDIQAVVIDKRDSIYVTIGDMEIYVSNEDAILARLIIERLGL